MVVVPKPNGNVRLCVDLTKLNEGVRRELYVMKKVEETLGSILRLDNTPKGPHRATPVF